MRLHPALARLLVSSLALGPVCAPLHALAAEPTPMEAAPPPAEASPATPTEPPPTEPPPVRLPTELEMKQERARALVKRGQELAAGRFTSEALAAFRAALAVWPAYPLAHYELAVTLAETRDLPGAEANLKAALALAPGYARAHQALGEVYRRQKRLDDARASYLEAVRLAPEDTVAWYGLAVTLKAQKSEAEALWALESLLAVPNQNTDAPVAVEARKEAAAMIGRGVTAKALEVKAPELVAAPEEPKPEEPKPEEPKPEEPKPEEPEAVAIAGTPGTLGRKEGDKAFAEKRYVEALRLYLSAWEELVPPPKPAPAPAPEASPAAEVSPAPAGTTPPAPTATTGTTPPAPPAPADPAPAPAPGPAATAAPTPEPAPDAEAPRGDPELAYRIGATYAVMNDLKPAIRWWMTALHLAPQRELIARHLGLLLRKVRAAEPEPTPISGAVRIERAKALLREGDAASALMLVKNREEIGAGHLEAESRLRLGDFKAARQIFEELLAADPEDRIANAGLGEALFRLGEQDLARKAINAWMGDEKSHPETFIVLRRGELEARLLAPHEPED